MAATMRGADLSATTVKHLYCLQTHAEHVRKLFVAQKLGGGTFDNFNAQLLSYRIGFARLVQLQKQEDSAPPAC